MSNKINVTFAGKWENKLNVHDAVHREKLGQGIPEKEELDRGEKKAAKKKKRIVEKSES